MRGNKRAVCFVLAVLLVLGCLGMAGCKEPHPEYYVVGDLKIYYIPDNWELTDSINGGNGDYAYWFGIDEKTTFRIIYRDTTQSIEDYYQSAANSYIPKYERSEILETRTIDGKEALHYIVYYKISDESMIVESCVVKCEEGLVEFCIEKLPDSQYVINEEEFGRILDSAVFLK